MRPYFNINLVIIFIVFSTGCNSSKCGNTGSPVGKYLADTYEETELYLLIKQDSTFIHHYKDRTGKISEKTGKWSLSKSSCSINLDPWYLLSKEGFPDRPVLMSAIFEDDKIMPYIDVPIYKKEK